MLAGFLLPFILFFPLISALLLLVISGKKVELLKQLALLSSIITFLFSLLIWILFDNSSPDMQFSFTLNWLFPIKFGIDGISLFLIILTTFLIPICILIGWNSITNTQGYFVKFYLILFLIMESFILGVFSILDLFCFYILFESILLPMFLIIGIWGSRERKIHAAYQFFLYTLLGSLFMLIGLIYMYVSTYTTNIEYFMLSGNTIFSPTIQKYLWLAMFLSFAVKVPMIPFHLWLPEAHVEAPTAGSVILAGILLKLGTYGFIRFSLTMFPMASIYFTPIIFLLSLLGIIYSSLTTIRQIDLKKIIAYSSIGHMAFVTLGIFSTTIEGIEGAIVSMISHGIVSSALFICVGILYDRHKTRIIKYYRGLASVMPIFATIKLILIMANISVPGTSSFIGEILILIGTYQANKLVSIIAALGIILSAIYGIWYYNRIAYGQLTNYITKFNDVSLRELTILMPFVFLIFLIGIYPDILLNSIHTSVLKIIINKYV